MDFTSEAQSALVEMKWGAAVALQALRSPFLSDLDWLQEQAKHKRVQSRFHYNAIMRRQTGGSQWRLGLREDQDPEIAAPLLTSCVNLIEAFHLPNAVCISLAHRPRATAQALCFFKTGQHNTGGRAWLRGISELKPKQGSPEVRIPSSRCSKYKSQP